MTLRVLQEDIFIAFFWGERKALWTYFTALEWYDPLWYDQVVNIRIHYARKLKELTDKLAESKNEQSKLKLAAENAAQYKKITPTRTIKVRGPFWIYIHFGMLIIGSALGLSGSWSGIKITGLGFLR